MQKMQRKYELTQADIEDGIQFDILGRMKYNPSYHENHGKPFTIEELEYMCKYYEIDGFRSMGFALGRTEHTIASKVSDLRKSGMFEFYKNLNRYW